MGIHIQYFRLTLSRFHTNLIKWPDSLRVESVTTKSTHFVALPEYPRNSPHRAAWVSSLSPLFSRTWLLLQAGLTALACSLRIPDVSRPTLMPGTETRTLNFMGLGCAARRAPPPRAERPTSQLRCGSFCPSAKSYCRCRTMSAVDERQIDSRPRGFSPSQKSALRPLPNAVKPREIHPTQGSALTGRRETSRSP